MAAINHPHQYYAHHPCQYRTVISYEPQQKQQQPETLYHAKLVNTTTSLPVQYGEPLKRESTPQQPLNGIRTQNGIYQIPIKIQSNSNQCSPSWLHQLPINMIDTNSTPPNIVQQPQNTSYRSNNRQSNDSATVTPGQGVNENFDDLYKKNLRKLSTNEQQRFYKLKPNQLQSPVSYHYVPPSPQLSTFSNNSNEVSFEYGQQQVVQQSPLQQTIQANGNSHSSSSSSSTSSTSSSASSAHHQTKQSILSKLSTFANTVQQKAFNRTTTSSGGGGSTHLVQRKHLAKHLLASSPASTYTTSSSSSSTSSSSPTSSISSINNLNYNDKNKKFQNDVWYYDEGEELWCTISEEKKLRVKLTKIHIKSLNIFELIYLKQLCLVKLQKILNNFNITVPKDESIKSVNKGNFKLRSKSVDYKLALFDDITKTSSSSSSSHSHSNKHDDASCVFGQSLYKCILNDMSKKKKQIYVLRNVTDGTAGGGATIHPATFNKMKNEQQRRNSVLFEALDLSSKQRQFQQNENDGPVLGNNASNGLVPEIIKQSCEFIEKYGLDIVGIFRIDSSKKRIKEIREQFDTGRLVEFDIDDHNPLDVACLLKEYLRSLPEPLLTRKLYSAFIASNKIKEPLKRLEAIRCLVCLLPVPNRDTLQYILKLLDKLRSHCFENQQKQKGGNKMDSFNLAMIFGPNILQKRKINSNKEYSVDKNALIDDIESVISITKYLIENQKHLFHIESEMHNDIVQKVYDHHQNEMNNIMQNKLKNSIGIKIYGNNYVSNGSGNSDTESNNTDSSGYSSLLTNTAVVTGQFQNLNLDNESTLTTTTTSSSIRTLSTPAQIELSTNTPIYLTMQMTSNKLKTKQLSANRNVYIKNRAYFPISHMNKNLINNLNEENKKTKTETQPLLMISTSSNDTINSAASSSALSRAKSLSNLNNTVDGERNRLHFIGEQETLV